MGSSAATRAWIRSARPLAHPTIVVPMALGGCFAFAAREAWSLDWQLIALSLGVLLHLVIVWTNDLCDHTSDAAQPDNTPVSGGSRVLVDGALSRTAIGRAVLVALSSLAVLAGFLACWRPHTPLWAGAALALVFAYNWPFGARATAPRWRGLSHHGGGEWAQTLGTGALLPLWGYDLQVGHLETFPWPVLLPSSALAMASHIATALPDAGHDRNSNKRTIAVRLGSGTARWLAVALTGISAGWLALSSEQTWPWLAGLLLVPAMGSRPVVQQSLFLLSSIQLLLIGWCLSLVH